MTYDQYPSRGLNRIGMIVHRISNLSFYLPQPELFCLYDAFCLV